MWPVQCSDRIGEALGTVHRPRGVLPAVESVLWGSGAGDKGRGKSQGL